MRITREQLGRIIQEEAMRLQEAKPKNASSRGTGSRPAVRKGPTHGSGYGGGPLSVEEDEDAGSYETVVAGEQMERFAEALKEYAALIPRGPGSRARGAAELRSELTNLADKLKELSTRWNRLMLPNDEY